MDDKERGRLSAALAVVESVLQLAERSRTDLDHKIDRLSTKVQELREELAALGKELNPEYLDRPSTPTELD